MYSTMFQKADYIPVLYIDANHVMYQQGGMSLSICLQGQRQGMGY